MAGGVSGHSQVCAAAVAIAALLLICAPRAQALEDPTRPPASLGRSGAARSPASDLVLQSVIIFESGSAALINGELVQLGARFGNARLVKVSESEVELLIGNARRTLALFPGVDKRRAIRGNDGGVR